MTARVDLVWLGAHAEPPAWTIGATHRVAANARAVHEVIAARAAASTADAWLFWDSTLAAPVPERVLELLDRPGDLWHAGLSLGSAGAPGIIDLITPTWTFNRDADATVEATSWRVSIRACLARTSVLRWSAPSPEFDSLEGAALEWGHRCITNGVLPRNAPSLLGARAAVTSRALTLADEFRFARARFGARWCAWAALRAAISGYARFEDIADSYLSSRSKPPSQPPSPFVRPSAQRLAPRPAVTVLIPTLDRYAYLRTILAQLRSQTVRPLEVIVVDQTPAARRAPPLEREFPDLPIHTIVLEQAGQCTSRNAGLARARGDAILFVDDDDEVAPDLIERHLEHLARSGGAVSSGVANEPSAGSLPAAFRIARPADVFPTNNTLARREAFEQSGLFDVAYDHGARADGDLGMRVYLSGSVMMLEPAISVLHHHAPSGGLRAHGARVVTYASSRRRITHRHLPEVTEIYRSLRYFSAAQVRESLVQSAVATLSAHGGAVRRTVKLVYGTLMMPDTIWRLRARLASARAMLTKFPQIPTLPPAPR